MLKVTFNIYLYKWKAQGFYKSLPSIKIESLNATRMIDYPIQSNTTIFLIDCFLDQQVEG